MLNVVISENVDDNVIVTYNITSNSKLILVTTIANCNSYYSKINCIHM